MLLVSLPHDKIVDLNTKYLVYDTDDGIIEKAWATDILSMYYKNRDMFPNIQQTKYGGMLRKPFMLPDGQYSIGGRLTYSVKDGIPIYAEPIKCEFIGLLGRSIVAVRDMQIKVLGTID